MKKRNITFICCIIVSFIVIVLFKVVTNFSTTKDDITNFKEITTERASQKFYSITLPKGYTIKQSDDVKYEDYIYMGEEKIASIDINPDCEYCLDLSSIISNWIGMSAYIEDDVEKKDFDTYQRYKTLIAFEPSSVEEEKGESLPEQLHYFFVKNNLLLDLSFDSDYLDEKNADFIANAIELE